MWAQFEYADLSLKIFPNPDIPVIFHRWLVHERPGLEALPGKLGVFGFRPLLESEPVLRHALKPHVRAVGSMNAGHEGGKPVIKGNRRKRKGKPALSI